MKKLLLLLPLLFFNSLIIYSQAPTIQWEKSYGGSKNDEGEFIQQTIDGGYIIAGFSYSADGDCTNHHGSITTRDYWILKIDNLGSIQWETSLGGTSDDGAYSVQQTFDKGYIIAGLSNSNNGDVTGNHATTNDFWIVKLSELGIIQWQKSLGGSGNDLAFAIQQTTDKGYIVSGASTSIDGDVTFNNGGALDYWVVKVDSLGALQWQKSYGGTSGDISYSIQQTLDGGYIVAGESRSQDGNVIGNHGGTDCWLIKIDNLGTIQWKKCYGGTGEDGLNSIKQTFDKGYVVVGYSSSNNGNVTSNNGSYDYWVIKLDSLGIIQWQKSLGGSVNEFGYTIEQTIDGGYIVGGQAGSNDGNVSDGNGDIDYWIVKLNNLGVIQWQKSLGGTGADFRGRTSQTNDGGYIVIGRSPSSDGDVTWNNGSNDYWVVKLNPTIGIEENSTKNSITISPNPSTDQFNFQNLEKENSIEVYDLTGRLIFQTVSKNNSCTIDLSNKDNGIYFYKVIGNNIFSGKLIKQ